MKLRAEWFGGLLQLDSPRLLLGLNPPAMRLLGMATSERWEPTAPRQLSAPLEVQFLGTRRCTAGCRACSVDARPRGAELSLETAKSALEALARAGVFTVAFGGGEPLSWPSLFDAAEHARSLGLACTLTTSGLGLTKSLAARAGVFDAVHVSLDGVGEVSRAARGFDGTQPALDTVAALRPHVSRLGLNAVVMRSTYPHLDQLFCLARRQRLGLQLLRFKPVGRGARVDEALTEVQARAFFPRVRWLALRHRVRLRLDCALAPFVFWHRPPLWQARLFGVVGCAAGQELAAVMPEGTLQGCTFAGTSQGSASDPASIGRAFKSGFRRERGWALGAPEPCNHCEYLEFCRGGCRAVAAHAGAGDGPDPDCPKVRDWSRSRTSPPGDLVTPT